jgi:single-stranded-DNA-specific exonuclease
MRTDVSDAIFAAYRARTGSEEAAVRFLTAEPASIPRPAVLRGLAEAADRIEQAIAAGERIGIFGHDDADGITSAAVLTEALGVLGTPARTYIPDRDHEGHGLYPDLVRRFAGSGVKLLVTTDGCSSNRAETELAATLGMDVLVTDHHEVAEGRATPDRLLNPKAHPETAESHGDLTGAGVAALLARELFARAGRPEEDFLRLLDLVALGTIADWADLGDNNRAMVVQGLRRVERDDRPGIAAARRALGLESGDLWDTESVRRFAAVFASIPSVDGESPGLRALLGEAGWKDDVRALVGAHREIEAVNTRAAEAAERFARATGIVGGEPAVVELVDVPLRSLGAAATRLVELTAQPAAVLLREGDRVACELRGPAGVHLVEILGSMRELLASWGGHRAAAGFSADASRAAELKARLGAAFREFVAPPLPSPTVEGTLAESDLGPDLVRSVIAAAPFGKGNPAPVLRALGLQEDSTQIGWEGFPEGPGPGDPLVTLHPRGRGELVARFRGWSA